MERQVRDCTYTLTRNEEADRKGFRVAGKVGGGKKWVVGWGDRFMSLLVYKRGTWGVTRLHHSTHYMARMLIYNILLECIQLITYSIVLMYQ